MVWVVSVDEGHLHTREPTSNHPLWAPVKSGAVKHDATGAGKHWSLIDSITQ